jgi:tRNA pseudouridine55 synthase
MNGLILVDKSRGMSSAAVVGITRRRLRLDRVGHAGTLDPFATGLLVLLVGRATRLAGYAVAGKKVYSAEIIFGTETDTDDSTGEAIGGSGQQPDIELVRKAALAFQGTIYQEPPQFSAKKVEGRRAYAIARGGARVALDAVPVTIDSFSLWCEVGEGGIPRYFFRVACSKGTYIRSLARDLGRAMGCGAHLASLRREGSIPFSVEEATVLEGIGPNSVIRWDRLFPDAHSCILSEGEVAGIERGLERSIKDVISRLNEETDHHQEHAVGLTHDGAPHAFFVRSDHEWRFVVCTPGEWGRG